MFYISISNGLLDDNHYDRMGACVWQFMWCLDKVTRIDETGDGWVLGGKPIRLSEIPFGSKNTHSRNLNELQRQGYVELIHAPYGIVIKVKKAKKRFTKNSEAPQKRNTKIDEPQPVFGEPNKIEAEDKTKNKDITAFIELFSEVNPTFKALFGFPAQRRAAKRMLDLHELGWWERFMTAYATKFSDRYCPKATTPVQLEEKLGGIMAYAQSSKKSKVLIV